MILKKKILIAQILLSFILGGNDVFGEIQRIKSLRVYSGGDETLLPVINILDEAQSSINIEFDVEANTLSNLAILFRFCDSEWKVYESAFLLNPLYNTEYNLYLERLPQNVRSAQYHYSGVFPNNNVKFPYSGKWKFFIVDQFDRSKIFGEGKFYVVHPEVKLNYSFYNESLQGGLSELAPLNRRLAIKTEFVLPDSLFPNLVSKVEIVMNRKVEYPIIIEKNQNSFDRFFEWNAGNQFSFMARNIFPSNEYRKTDLRDYGKYNSSNVQAQFGDIETSNFYKKGRRDFNGGSLFPDFRSEQSDYLNVLFKIRLPDEISDPVFLVGSFTNWQVLPEYELYDDNGLLYLNVELKRGYYEYQYVTGKVENGRVDFIDWNILEGNFSETENEYNIFLYYRTEESGTYDKIIGYKKIKASLL